jgi:hypothetical protein
MRITRRTFAIAVRVIAVLAAIYTFFMFRSQLAEQRSPGGGRAIPAKVISRETACGWLKVDESLSDSGKQIALDQNRAILAAIQKPGELVVVRDPEECSSLIKRNGSIISADKRMFKINFSEAP